MTPEETQRARDAYLLGQLTVDLRGIGYQVIGANPSEAELIVAMPDELIRMSGPAPTRIALTVKEITEPPD